MDNTEPRMGCPYCSFDDIQVYHMGKCPRIKSIEYNQNGTVKKVEFWAEEVLSEPEPYIHQPNNINSGWDMGHENFDIQ